MGMNNRSVSVVVEKRESSYIVRVEGRRVLDEMICVSVVEVYGDE
jgi:hypothetical protein